jgi:hypothetical protein
VDCELVDEGLQRSTVAELEDVLDVDNLVDRLAIENFAYDFVHEGLHVRTRPLVLFPHAEEDESGQARRQRRGPRVAHLVRLPVLEHMLAREEVVNLVVDDHVLFGIVVHVGGPDARDLVTIAGDPLVVGRAVALGVAGGAIHEDLLLRRLADGSLEILDLIVVSVVAGDAPRIPAHGDDVDALLGRPLNSLWMASSAAHVSDRTRQTYLGSLFEVEGSMAQRVFLLRIELGHVDRHKGANFPDEPCHFTAVLMGRHIETLLSFTRVF